MGIYCTAAFLRSYVEDSGVTLPAQDAEVERLIARAERDIDRLVGPHVRDPISGLKLTPTALSVHQASALARGCAAQAEWLAHVGPERMLGDDDGSRSMVAGGVTLDFAAPSRGPSPKAVEELRSAEGLIVTALIASPEA